MGAGPRDAEVPNALVTRPKLPVRTAHEFISHVKANAGKVSYASRGNDTTSHLTAKLFETAAGAEMIHVPYRGDTRAMAGLAAGRSMCFFTNLSATMARAQSGQGPDPGRRGRQACGFVA
ncbi:hypothetical protein EZ313_21400 [Ramlibacter henchirensis]|uniref:Tripartite tricarboxylate transporter substrate binding protein n=1 Tax=Ramlibacter henchirensis TaxID=204072 RepID=A0A4Z0BRA5_9BURK|nr:tripartite tricarboxylate transporter substrate-binding protein [Ramlibacter henchirensis]TFZ00984.1 hypothetical protein EZ313_21400 [Ramlibacter henchirensis]